jgi:hypothetical protein
MVFKPLFFPSRGEEKKFRGGTEGKGASKKSDGVIEAVLFGGKIWIFCGRGFQPR